jgi:hypothetical protein
MLALMAPLGLALGQADEVEHSPAPRLARLERAAHEAVQEIDRRYPLSTANTPRRGSCGPAHRRRRRHTRPATWAVTLRAAASKPIR